MGGIPRRGFQAVERRIPRSRSGEGRTDHIRGAQTGEGRIPVQGPDELVGPPGPGGRGQRDGRPVAALQQLAGGLEWQSVGMIVSITG